MEKLTSIIPKDIRASLYIDQCDPLMSAALGYEHEGKIEKAAEMWGLYDLKKKEIRDLYPD